MNSRPSYDSETPWRVGLECVSIFGHDGISANFDNASRSRAFGSVRVFGQDGTGRLFHCPLHGHTATTFFGKDV